MDRRDSMAHLIGLNRSEMRYERGCFVRFSWVFLEDLGQKRETGVIATLATTPASMR